MTSPDVEAYIASLAADVRLWSPRSGGASPPPCWRRSAADLGHDGQYP
ncbi:MAG TPA: hypothetical protein VF843_18430 [Streptosporangiaceae bacterium]